MEHRISSTKSSLVKLNATLAIQQDEMDCWQRIAHLAPNSPVSTTLSKELSNQHKQRVALLAKLQQHTAALAVQSTKPQHADCCYEGGAAGVVARFGGGEYAAWAGCDCSAPRRRLRLTRTATW